MDINAGIVAIPDEMATEHNLTPTQRFPSDTTKGVYTLGAFHTLHCLVCRFHLHVYDISRACIEADALPVRRISVVYCMIRIMADCCLAMLALQCTASTKCARTLYAMLTVFSFQQHQITMACKARKAGSLMSRLGQIAKLGGPAHQVCSVGVSQWHPQYHQISMLGIARFKRYSDSLRCWWGG